ncbi:TBC1 domain family member 31 [Hondaea fermentalgiana]|uniref:TBC1 domain family member 31 n=1 Tax=Hondaea fermentalgiana TaxID=2315210 RepID=A0A2R5GVU9_9STRA|nr:TBC1 domain family member 31 [Hondaea fermentalgiana]|eukprot:GBG34695.1 TBC1 domain family member 31 [Hondaea fermentalgiana]
MVASGAETTVEVGASGASGLLFSSRPTGFRDGGRFATVSAGPRARFETVAATRRGAEAVAVTERGDVYVLQTLSGSYRRVKRLGARPTSLAVAPSGTPREALVGLDGARGAVCLALEDTDEDPKRLGGHASTVTSVAYHPTRAVAATASAERVILWDTASWKRVKSLGGGGLGIADVAFTPRGDMVLVAFRDGSVMGWGAHDFELLVRLQTQDGLALSSLAVSPDSRYVVGAASGRLFVWELRAQALIRVVELPTQVTSVAQVRFAEDDFKVLVLGDDGVVRILQVLGRGEARATLHIATDVALSFAVSGNTLAICTSTGHLTLHDLDAAARFAAARDTRRPFVMDTRGVVPALQATNRRRHIEKLAGATSERKEDASAGGGVGAMDAPGSPPLVRLARNLNKQDKSLNAAQLARTLRQFGEFPEKYRTLVWRFLLRLPENAAAYATLTQKGPQPVWADTLYERFPVRSRKVFGRFERVLFALSNWCPVFEEVSYLPALVYPFVRVYGFDELAAFETIMLVIFRCCGHWFESFPHMPVFVLARVEKLLETVDPSLLAHLVEREVTSEAYAWPMLRSALTEVLDKKNWLCFWDHVVMQMHHDMMLHPGGIRRHGPDGAASGSWSPAWLLEAAVVAYLRYFRNSIMSLRRREDLEAFFRRPSPLDVKRWVKSALALCQSPKYQSFWASFIESGASGPGAGVSVSEAETWSSTPRVLPSGNSYPAFTKYPRFVVDYETQERKRIAAEEARLAERTNYIEELRKKTADLEHQEQSYMRLQQQLLKQEEERRAKHTAAQTQRLEEKEKLERAARLRRLERIEKMEDLTKENLSLQQQLRQAEAARTQAELDHENQLRELELEAHREEERIQALESEAALKLQKIHAERKMEQEMQDVRLSSARMAKQGELDWRLKEQAWQVEDEKLRIERELKTEQAARDSRLQEISLARRQLESKFATQQMETQMKIAALERERQVRTFKQDVSQTFYQDLDKKLEAERLLAEEEQRAKAKITGQYEAWTEGVKAERARILAQERRRALDDAQQRDARLARLQEEQTMRDFELQAERKMRETRAQLDKEEQDLQDQLLALDEQRRSDQAVEDELVRKQREIDLRQAYVRTSTGREGRRLQAERENMAALRAELDRSNDSGAAAHETESQ